MELETQRKTSNDEASHLTKRAAQLDQMVEELNDNVREFQSKNAKLVDASNQHSRKVQDLETKITFLTNDL